MGYLRTSALMALLTALVVAVAGMIGGTGAMLVALVIAAAMNFATYWWSDSIVLRMYGARIVARDDAPELHEHDCHTVIVGRNEERPWYRELFTSHVGDELVRRASSDRAVWVVG